MFYAVICIVCLVRSNPYQRSVWLSSANGVATCFYRTLSSSTSYIGLREINEELNRRNAELEARNVELRQIVQSLLLAQDSMSNIMSEALENGRYKYTTATVINSSVNRSNNYLTLDRGRMEGILPEQGVVDRNGVVGIVSRVSDHAALVISLLNPDLRLSCKLGHEGYLGSLIWDGSSAQQAILEELPRHAEINKGDTVFTSGFSSVFPEGIPVGVVNHVVTEDDGDFRKLVIDLAADFQRIGPVMVVEDTRAAEMRELEQGISK